MLYIKTKKLTKKEQDLCGLQGIFFLFNCQTPESSGQETGGRDEGVPGIKPEGGAARRLLKRDRCHHPGARGEKRLFRGAGHLRPRSGSGFPRGAAGVPRETAGPGAKAGAGDDFHH